MSKLSPILLLAFFVLLTGCLSDTFDASYDSMTDAVSRGAVSKGWVPPWLPQSATNIWEVHNLDTNASALAFEIPAGSIWQLPDHCRSVSFAETTPSQFNRSWWPSSAELDESYAFFRCKADASPDFVFVGIQKLVQRGLHWRAYVR